MDRFTEFKSYFENFVTGIVFHDRDTKVLYANSAAFNLLGLSFDQMLGKDAMDPYWRFIREDGSELPIAEYPVFQVLESKKRLENFVLGVRRSDLSKPIWVICNGHAEFDEDGNVALIIISFSDISYQKKTEAKLGEQLGLTEALIDSMLDGISILGSDGVQLDVNPAFLNMTGFSREELIGKGPPFPYWPPEELGRIQEAFTATLKDKYVNFELIFMRKNGERFPVMVSPSSVRDKDGKIVMYIASVKDITELKKTEKQLKEARDTAEIALKMKSRFLDMAAHELKTPVGSISMVLQYAKKKLEKGFAVETNTIDRLLEQTDRMSRLVVDLMSVSRLERGVLTLQISDTDIPRLVLSCVDDFRLRFPQREIRYTWSGSSFEARVDSVRIYQVLSNLIDNAIKYTSSSGAIEVYLEKEDKSFAVSVRDEGEGIKLENQEMVFNPFSRGENDFTDSTDGLGLGLYICREIIELHGGNIGVKSSPGSGAIFYFDLPLGTE